MLMKVLIAFEVATAVGMSNEQIPQYFTSEYSAWGWRQETGIWKSGDTSLRMKFQKPKRFNSACSGL
jgi:hypothetical protein